MAGCVCSDIKHNRNVEFELIFCNSFSCIFLVIDVFNVFKIIDNPRSKTALYKIQTKHVCVITFFSRNTDLYTLTKVSTPTKIVPFLKFASLQQQNCFMMTAMMKRIIVL